MMETSKASHYIAGLVLQYDKFFHGYACVSER